MKTGPNDKSPAIPRLFSRGCGAIFLLFNDSLRSGVLLFNFNCFAFY
jgi:hypothetical protein